jgi:hypothetical protein
LKIRLIRKLAERLEGIDLSQRRLGQTFELPIWEAMLLIAHGWAVRVDSPDPAEAPLRKREEPV